MKKNPVLLSFGANLGDPEKAFQQAAVQLEQGGFQISAVSEIYRNPAMDCEPGAPDFSNCAVLGNWTGTPEELLALCQHCEVQAGRPADHPYHYSRTLDIDILLMGELTLNSAKLTIPHKAIAERDFYLIPASWIAPDLPVPGTKKTIRELLNRTDARDKSPDNGF